MENNGDIIWQPITRHEILTTRVFTVCEKDSKSPEGETKTFISLKAPDWVIIVPVYKNEKGEDIFIMVKQWRHGTDSIFIEFPGGVVDNLEEAQTAAKRELLEETGRKTYNIHQLGVLSPNPAIMENYCHIFLAEVNNQIYSQNLDEDEFLHVIEVPVKKVIENMGKAPYSHSIMNAALFLYLKYKHFTEI